MTEQSRIPKGVLIHATGPITGNVSESSEQRVQAAHRQTKPISGIVLNDRKNVGVVVSDAEHNARSANLVYSGTTQVPEASLSPVEPQPSVPVEGMPSELPRPQRVAS